MPLAPLQICEHAPLAQLTTMGVGGPARWLIPVDSAEACRAAYAFARAQGVPTWVVAGGSNCIIADAGLPGVVLHPTIALGSSGIVEKGPGHVCVAAGTRWDDLVAWSVDRGWQGLEALSGIPGQVGAAPIQNIGAYGQELADVLLQLDGYEVASDSVRTWNRDQCAFAYRDSWFKRHPGAAVVTAVHLQLRPGAIAEVRYDQLAAALHPFGAGASPTLQQVRDAVLQLRRSKGMVVDPADGDSRSCGSFFTNPLVDASTAERALQLLQRAGETAPAWPQPDGRVKLSAAWLIERSGWQRGQGRGSAGLSSKHALAIINRGGATAAEILAFADEVAAQVADRSGVHLQREPVLLG